MEFYGCAFLDDVGSSGDSYIGGHFYNCSMYLETIGVDGDFQIRSGRNTSIETNVGPTVGTLYTSSVEADDDNDAMTVEAGSEVIGCVVQTGGTGKAINADSSINAKVAGCQLSGGIGANVTNDVTTPHNVDLDS
jgi:hypothetical protein